MQLVDQVVASLSAAPRSCCSCTMAAQVELVARAGETLQPHALEAMMGLQVRNVFCAHCVIGRTPACPRSCGHDRGHPHGHRGVILREGVFGEHGGLSGYFCRSRAAMHDSAPCGRGRRCRWS